MMSNGTRDESVNPRRALITSRWVQNRTNLLGRHGDWLHLEILHLKPNNCAPSRRCIPASTTGGASLGLSISMASSCLALLPSCVYRPFSQTLFLSPCDLNRPPPGMPLVRYFARPSSQRHAEPSRQSAHSHCCQ